ncbi:MAG TPA: YIP1 family protein [Myxococcota bacterium]|nr:YIP1 family protein [Myxococcota bacterium]HRY96531.1 YIP1 family protein [Myxococcota bacterium]HSA23228.1 YIP1 family protein [Myxococcota bacterium]
MVAINFKVLFQRVLELLASPEQTWRAIQKEPDPGRALMVRYTALLALLPALVGLLGGLASGQGFLASLVLALLRSGIAFGTAWTLALMLNSLAPSFGTVRSQNAALKLVSYASTPVWVAGLLTIIPPLLPLAALAGFGYTAFLLHGGCQRLMDTPREKAWPFALTLTGIWFFKVLVLSWFVALAASSLLAPATPIAPPTP